MQNKVRGPGEALPRTLETDQRPFIRAISGLPATESPFFYGVQAFRIAANQA